ncbi:HpcH/HpaI aldolase family protein [Kineococcus sp. SYSU DK003]|uniref:HpcH/HpaI aldolase family protein n=1 Tax=Kineococcus sp. SYSU DK003 TaxID=3383124 RepID=UPI003D7E7AB1
MIKIPLRTRLQEGPVLATFAGLAAPSAVEVLAWSGFDTVCVDAEHSALDPSTLAGAVRAGDAAGCDVLVRVPELGADVGRALDLGAAGIVVPRVENAAQAEAAVAAVRYPPRGARGAGPGRAARYGATIPQVVATADKRVVLALQVETRRGVEAVGDIAAVDGVDVLFVGPGDLAVSLGAPPGSAEHDAAVTRVLDAARDAGRHAGIFCRDPEQAGRYAALGVRLLVLGSDAGFLTAAATTVHQRARAALAAGRVDA